MHAVDVVPGVQAVVCKVGPVVVVTGLLQYTVWPLLDELVHEGAPTQPVSVSPHCTAVVTV
jgi:hypothetical protein